MVGPCAWLACTKKSVRHPKIGDLSQIIIRNFRFVVQQEEIFGESVPSLFFEEWNFAFIDFTNFVDFGSSAPLLLSPY